MLQITENTQINFKTIAKWSRFLGIVNMIAGVFLILFSFAPFFLSYPGMESVKWILFFVYLVFGVLVIWVSYTLYTSGLNIKEGVKTQNQLAFDQGIENQKTIFVFTGYMTIIAMVLYAIILVGFIIANASYTM